ncbi:Uncharacterised protein r2_g1219 [Pycnogonum litorale]
MDLSQTKMFRMLNDRFAMWTTITKDGWIRLNIRNVIKDDEKIISCKPGIVLSIVTYRKIIDHGQALEHAVNSGKNYYFDPAAWIRVFVKHGIMVSTMNGEQVDENRSVVFSSDMWKLVFHELRQHILDLQPVRSDEVKDFLKEFGRSKTMKKK